MDKLGLYAAIAVALWFAQLLYKTLTSPLRYLPGPFYTLLTRLPLKLSIITGQRVHFIHALHKQHGRIVRISPSEISISSLPEFKEIHRSGSGYLKTKWYQALVMGAVPGVFAMRDVRDHAARRRLLARAFSKSELREVWEGVVRVKVRVAVQKMKGEMDRREGRCDVLKWWTFLATDVAGHLMFGEDFGMVELGVKNEYIHVLESTMKGSGINAELPLIGFLGRHIPIASVRAMFRASDYLASYGRRAVTNARTTSESSRNIFSGMIYASEKSDTGLSEIDIVTEAGNLIVAGSDTTAVTLTYLVYAVLSQPRLQRELEDELRGLEEGYDDATLETLPLLNAVIKETLRLYGAAPGSLPRDIPEGGATLAGYYVPEGVTVSTQSYTIHRDPEIYPDSEVFDASRWLGESEKSAKAGQLAYSPFGAGSRICLGIHLAYMELRLAAAEFFRECRGVKLAPSVTKESMAFENYFLIAPRGHKCEVVKGRV
ncbi:cytochrome P450 [Aspergillus karnatakaensis]|uniref:cytochrome P450 n=1 Tax=Aspergillus karnatakaensis TaxID=1810916 RepID=UPI003CCDA15B